MYWYDRTMVDRLIHRWLKLPYTLNIRYLKQPKKPRATILFIHGIGNTGEAWNGVIQGLPEDIRVVTIDLLGFGDSPSPKWAVYDAKTQARSVLATYLKLRIMSPVIIVGHSLGALVAIEVAKRYPLLVKSLILCSPPLYDVATVPQRFRFKSDGLLRRIYQSVERRPEDFVKLSAIAMKYNLINKSFNVTDDNVDAYMATLESMIINQTSFEDAHNLRIPTLIIRGRLDPFVVARNINKLMKANDNINTTTILAAHEVRGAFIGAVIKAINSQSQR